MDNKNEQKTKINLTYQKFVTQFHPAITSLGSLNIKDIPTLIAISKAKKMADELIEEYNLLRTKIAEQDCIKDKKTKEPKIINNKYEYPNDKTKIETNKKLIELLKTEITLNLKTININNLEGVEGLTANTIVSLFNFITE